MKIICADGKKRLQSSEEENFEGAGCVVLMAVIVSRLYALAALQIVFFKYLQFIACQSYLSETV